MKTQTIQRQYDDVIAAHYDLDPQGVVGDSLRRAAAQLEKHGILAPAELPLRVLDVGLGTGRFLALLQERGLRELEPFGLDLSRKMVEIARRRIPNLAADIDDAARLEAHFPGQSFELICTHFLTGFVPLSVLAPKIHHRLRQGGYWSFVGGTKAGFPALRAKAENKMLRWLVGGQTLAVDDLVCNPAGREEIVPILEAHGFAVRECETFEPPVRFANFKAFMDFAYRGGWLTPFVEALGLHQASPAVRLMLNALVFPLTDHHNIEIVLAQKLK
ncbi:MAG: class I SAM-dependent methyltransferase [Gemmataceae bacterium]|nr:class I SAM-dependent methyltransferase [Gemmataceae bacterium]MDW8267162.1 class I SAM-dependent methyltransferase [Gemmataceae bacterium]